MSKKEKKQSRSCVKRYIGTSGTGIKGLSIQCGKKKAYFSYQVSNEEGCKKGRKKGRNVSACKNEPIEKQIDILANVGIDLPDQLNFERIKGFMTSDQIKEYEANVKKLIDQYNKAIDEYKKAHNDNIHNNMLQLPQSPQLPQLPHQSLVRNILSLF